VEASSTGMNEEKTIETLREALRKEE